VGLAGVNGEADAFEDLLGALLRHDADVEVLDFKGGHLFSVLLCPGLRGVV
jgi:hypothetical protein